MCTPQHRPDRLCPFEYQVIWDVEENSEEQLQAILAASAVDEEGLYHWEGKTLQFVTEGGGYFDSRRPAFFGTHVKTSDKFSARNPLGQDPELDYEYESDIDWESETGDGEDLMSDLGEEEEEEEEEDEGGGFVVADGEWDAGVDGVSSRKKVRKLNQVRCVPPVLLLFWEHMKHAPFCSMITSQHRNTRDE